MCQRGVSTCAGRAGWIGWGLGGGGWIVISTNANRRFLNSFSFSRVWFFVSSLFSCLRLRSRNLSIRSVRSGAVGWGVGGGGPNNKKQTNGAVSNQITSSYRSSRVGFTLVLLFFGGRGRGQRGRGLELSTTTRCLIGAALRRRRRRRAAAAAAAVSPSPCRTGRNGRRTCRPAF